MKKKIKKGADPSIIIQIYNDTPEIMEMGAQERKSIVKKLYSNEFARTSKETIKANVREDIVVRNANSRFLSKLPQDLNGLDIIAAHYDIDDDVIKITFAQQKGNNASFNSSSEAKTLENISRCANNKIYVKYFNLLPDDLNPLKNGKNYDVDFCVGMVNACGSNEKKKDDVVINYYCGNKYLRHLGIEIDTVDLAYQVSYEEKVLNHKYNAVDECDNFDYIYDKCEEKLIRL